MGYYNHPKSYLRTKNKQKATQKILAISAASVILVATYFNLFVLQVTDTSELFAAQNAIAPVSKVQNPSIEKIETSGVSIINSNTSFPVVVAFFYAKQNPTTVELKWSCVIENNNSCFIVEKSENGSAFTIVELIESNGSGKTGPDYIVTDNEPSGNTIFYRLSQVSTDGKKNFIALEKINRDASQNDLALYIENVGPETFNDFLDIDYYSERSGGVCVEILDKKENRIFKSYTEADQGYNTCRFIDGNILTDNEYIVRIANSSGVYVKKIKKQI
jgi:hypothetical protein